MAIKELTGIQLLVAAVIFLSILAVIQHLLTATSLKQLKAEPSLGKRMVKYVAIVMTRYWTFSAMVLFCGGITFVTGNLNLLYPLPAISLLFYYYWPSPARMTKDLKLKPEEAKIMRNKKLGT